MIVLNRVTKSFYPGGYGLFDLSLAINTGEALVVTGKTGAGKTTLMKLITKEYLPDKGEIYFDKQLINKIKLADIHQLRRKIGVIFQDFLLLPELTAWENIALPLFVTGTKNDEIKKRVNDLLKLLDLNDKQNLFPSQLSGGEAGRVSIARALALGPEVIFADEPTGNLDSQTSANIGHILKKINSLGTTLILATHDPIVIDIFSDKRRIKIEAGRLISDSQPNNFDQALTNLVQTNRKAHSRLLATFWQRIFKRPKKKKKFVQQTKTVEKKSKRGNKHKDRSVKKVKNIKRQKKENKN